ncbi:unannotated protein [freshwater metagenome]|uniref:Unannotated protein n=1 Tax=freshwater metagenome TaxID=449393 RepID=A0A6J7FQF0_9ZZZZ
MRLAQANTQFRLLAPERNASDPADSGDEAAEFDDRRAAERHVRAHEITDLSGFRRLPAVGAPDDPIEFAGFTHYLGR